MINLKLKTRQFLQDFTSSFKNALPVILFFIFLFYTIVLLFGTRYSIIVSFFTTIFQVRRPKPFSLKGMLLLVAEQMGICLLAFFATLNLPLCILFNAIVPFFLVYLQSTQFYPKGYFTNAMAFVFLQLLPVGPAGLLRLMGVIAYALTVLILAFYLYSLLHHTSQNYSLARKGLTILSDEFSLMSEGKYQKESIEKLLSFQGTLHNMAYKSRGTRHVVRGEGKIHYMFALLFQRASYFIQEDSAEDSDHLQADRELLRKTAAFLKKTGQNFNLEDNEPLIQEACELLGETDKLSERFSIFLRSFLHLLVLTLHDITEISHEKNTEGWTLPRYVKPFRGIKERLRLDNFEVRFALRLSLVMVLSFTLCRVTDINHSYWLPLNAFLLVQPMYEDSAHRMKTRLLGTIIGSIFAFLLFTQIHGLTGHFLFATIMVSLMYCFVPGTVIQAVCSTGFALSLTSLTMNSTTAVELRISYVLASVILVLIVNRFFFQTSLRGQFHHNMKELFYVEESYLTMLAISTKRQIDYGVVSETLTHFHLLYGQAADYLKRQGDNPSLPPYYEMLKCFWKMAATAEQMVFYVQTERLEPGKCQIVCQFAEVFKKELTEAEASYLEMPKLQSPDVSEIPELEEAYLFHLMKQYEYQTEILKRICGETWKRL